jgi:hypothetical protein
MLKEVAGTLLEHGQKLAKAEENARLLRKLDWPSDGRTFLYEAGGQVHERPIAPPLRRHQVETLEDLAAAVKLLGKKPVIWIGNDQIVGDLDDEDRRENVTLELFHSAVWTALEALETGNSRQGQADFVRLLRREFRASSEATKLLPAIRQIKFSRAASGYSNVQHGAESLGNTIENEVSGADAIGDFFTVPVNVYRNARLNVPDYRYPVSVDLEIDAARAEFIVRPMPDELVTVRQRTLDRIALYFKEQIPDVPTFFGTM